MSNCMMVCWQVCNCVICWCVGRGVIVCVGVYGVLAGV